jgi:cell division protein FtsB
LTNATAVGYNTIVDASDKVRIGNSNVTVIEGQVAFTSASDERLKKNIKDLTNGLDFITKLRPVEYQMRKGDDKINYGFIAQDIEKLVGTNNSLLTIGGDANRTLGLRYTDFIAPIVKAIQEQQLTIKEQQKEIDELKELVKTLMKK